MFADSLERGWKDIPASFKPQDGPVATSKLEIGAWLCQGPDFGERVQSLRYRLGYRLGQGKMPRCSSNVCGFPGLAAPARCLHFHLYSGDQVWPPASADSAVSI